MLTSPADRYRAALPSGLVEFPVSGFDSVDVAFHTATLTGGPDRPGGDGLGYGSTAEQARTGAFGELTEDVLTNAGLRVRPRLAASFRELSARQGRDRVQDPRTLCLPAGIHYDDDRPLQWLPMTRSGDGETVLVPAELAASAWDDLPGTPPADGWLTTVITNGRGAHFSQADATAHALLELLQRDGNTTAFRAMDRGVVVDLAGLEDPESLDLLRRLEAARIDVTVKLASTDFGMANVYAVGRSRDGSELVPIMATACGEAAHPDAATAIRKALHEFAAARSRKALMHGPLDLVRSVTPPGYLDTWVDEHPVGGGSAEQRAVTEMQAWTRLSTAELTGLLAGTVFAERSRVAFRDLPHWTPSEAPDLCTEVVSRLRTAGLDVLLDVHRSGDAVAVKALVPGLECETMSYARIGERGVRRLLEQDTGLTAVGRDPGGWAAVRLTAEAEERLGGPAWFDRAGADARVGRLYPLYREPGRHVVATLAAQGLAGAGR